MKFLSNLKYTGLQIAAEEGVHYKAETRRLRQTLQELQDTAYRRDWSSYVEPLKRENEKLREDKAHLEAALLQLGGAVVRL